MGLLQHFFLSIMFLFAPFLGANVSAHGVDLAPVPHATVLFGGDMMFDRSIRAAINQKGGDYVFSCLDPLLQHADYVVANLEGPITDNPSVSEGSMVGAPDNFSFTFATSTAMLLAKHRISMVNLGNNHIFNFRLSGVTSTEMYLDQAGVAHFGDPDKAESDRVARVSINGIPFSFVNWSDWTSDNTDHTVAQVRAEAANGRVVVVYTHWGEEYVPPRARVQTLAHQFVDAGAAIVIGSHPHIVQEHELYHGTYIYYSLGNLIFDQYWNDAVSHGLMLSVQFNKNGVQRIEEIPVSLERDRRTCPSS